MRQRDPVGQRLAGSRRRQADGITAVDQRRDDPLLNRRWGVKTQFLDPSENDGRDRKFVECLDHHRSGLRDRCNGLLGRFFDF